MSAEGTLRDSLNTSDPNRLPTATQILSMGDLLNLLITAATPTQSSVTVTSNVATLANVPSTLFQVNASAGTSTGVKTLLIGTQSIVPAVGQCVWTPGTKTVKFNAADAVSAAHFTYATAADVTASILQRAIGEQDV